MSYKQIPDYVLDLMMAGALSKTDMRVYAALLAHTSSNRGAKGRIVWPGYRTIHERLGAQVSNKDISKSIKRLETLGAILVRHGSGKNECGRGHANTYFLPKEPVSKDPDGVENPPHRGAVENPPRGAVENPPHYEVENPPTIHMKEPDVINQRGGGPEGVDPNGPATADEIRAIIEAGFGRAAT